MGFRDKQLMKERVARRRPAGPPLVPPRCARPRRAPPPKRSASPSSSSPSRAPAAPTPTGSTTPPSSTRACAHQHVQEVSCEEFVDGEEFTYDTVCIDGRPRLRERRPVPAPPAHRAHQRVDQPGHHHRAGHELSRTMRKGIELGARCSRRWAWARLHPHGVVPQANGEVVFGEIGCRPGGAHLVDQMNYTCDIDLFREWARAVCWQPSRPHRAQVQRRHHLQARPGPGPHHAIHGLEAGSLAPVGGGTSAAGGQPPPRLEADAGERRLRALLPVDAAEHPAHLSLAALAATGSRRSTG
jgi:hypothetical protein